MTKLLIPKTFSTLAVDLADKQDTINMCKIISTVLFFSNLERCSYEEEAWIYVDRVAGGNCHHCNLGLTVVARCTAG